MIGDKPTVRPLWQDVMHIFTHRSTSHSKSVRIVYREVPLPCWNLHPLYPWQILALWTINPLDPRRWPWMPCHLRRPKWREWHVPAVAVLSPLQPHQPVSIPITILPTMPSPNLCGIVPTFIVTIRCITFWMWRVWQINVFLKGLQQSVAVPIWNLQTLARVRKTWRQIEMFLPKYLVWQKLYLCWSCHWPLFLSLHSLDCKMARTRMYVSIYVCTYDCTKDVGGWRRWILIYFILRNVCTKLLLHGPIPNADHWQTEQIVSAITTFPQPLCVCYLVAFVSCFAGVACSSTFIHLIAWHTDVHICVFACVRIHVKFLFSPASQSIFSFSSPSGVPRPLLCTALSCVQ